MGLQIFSGPWWPNEDFNCSKCNTRCNGETNSMVLQNDNVIARWCDKCHHLEKNQKDSLCYINIDSILLNLYRPKYPSMLINPLFVKC